MSQKRILIVEDEAIIADDITERLATMGYPHVETAASAPEALTAMQKAPADLILLDIKLYGETDGITLAGQIRNRWHRPIIFLTAYANDELMARAKKTIPSGYLLKPFRDQELKAAIDMGLYKAEMEERLSRSREQFRTAFEKANIGMALTDMAGNIRHVNPELCRILGRTRKALTGTAIHTLILSEQQNEVEAFLDGARAGTVHSGRKEMGLLHEDGHVVPVDMTTTLVSDSAGTPLHFVTHILDISERKRSEKRQKKLESQLRQSQKMEALGTLAGGIAHDFNNILSAIIGYSELLSAELPPASEYQENAEEILKAGRRARDLVLQILRFSRKSEPNRKWISLSRHLEEARTMLRATIPTTVEIRMDLADTLPPVLVDPTQIHQLLLNLATNASHAMKETGGIFRIRLRSLAISDEQAQEYLDLKPGCYQKLSFSDNGCGMEAGTVERIFDPFFTSKETGKGTGLGLSMVHRIVQDHFGMIAVESLPSVGTTFHIYLPEGKPDFPQTEKTHPLPLPGGDQRILLVDDEAAIATITASMLTRLGYIVTAYTSPLEALADFHSRPHAFDLVLTDMTMPDMTGAALSRALLSIRPELPIVICTGYSETMDENAAISLGIRRYLQKPVALQELAITLHEICKKTPPVTDPPSPAQP